MSGTAALRTLSLADSTASITRMVRQPVYSETAWVILDLEPDNRTIRDRIRTIMLTSQQAREWIERQTDRGRYALQPFPIMPYEIGNAAGQRMVFLVERYLPDDGWTTLNSVEYFEINVVFHNDRIHSVWKGGW